MYQLEITFEEKHALINALDALMAKCQEMIQHFEGRTDGADELSYFKSEFDAALNLRNKIMGV